MNSIILKLLIVSYLGLVIMLLGCMNNSGTTESATLPVNEDTTRFKSTGEKYPYKISDFRPGLSKHFKKLAAEGELSYDQNKKRDRFLRDSCTKDELVKALSCENPLIRVEAYRAIVSRNEPDYFQILLSHLDDTSKVMWWYYDDARGNFMVSDLMIRRAHLSRGQKDTLVDVVLNNHIYLETSEWMMMDIKPQNKYYSIIKAQCQVKSQDCHHLSLTYALAKFNKPEDIPIIKKNFTTFINNAYCNDYFFRAIEIFPNSAFFPILTKYFDTEIKIKKQLYYDELKYYCRAVAKFKNQSSLRILTALTIKGTYPDTWYLPRNKEYVFKAIHKYHSPIYDNLYQELKPEMDNYVMDYLNEPDDDDDTTW